MLTRMAPTLSTRTDLPLRRNGSAMAGSRLAGAHSITRSASGSSSLTGTTGGAAGLTADEILNLAGALMQVGRLVEAAPEDAEAEGEAGAAPAGDELAAEDAGQGRL